MRDLFTGLLLICLLPFSGGQTLQTFQKTATIEGAFVDFAVDDLLHLYTLDQSNELIKFDLEGKALFRYSNNKMGKPATMDVSNPLNILLFYPDYMTAITLNRTLSESGRFDLFGPRLLEVTAACLSIENNLWVFDASNFQLKLIDGRGQVIEKSDDLRLYFNAPPVITQMEAHKGYLYANVPESGIVIFDNFAQFDKELPFPHLIHFQFLQNNLIFQRENNLFQLDLNGLRENPVKLPREINENTLVKVKNNYLFFLEKGKGIEIWKITKE
ncbi:MAG: hypothetical protein KDC85_13775 [Saprospiraceae bacterium]|nr:hypothetical protein [Saprospiraceae bacterium]MCB9325173.1 hypothetical protein [Lewinellaceae bacterium]